MSRSYSTFTDHDSDPAARPVAYAPCMTADLPTRSPWIEQLRRGDPPRPLDRDLVTDVAVIGAGIAGLPAAGIGGLVGAGIGAAAVTLNPQLVP